MQLVGGEFDGRKIGVHLALADRLGDSVIIEYLDGEAQIYHGKEHTVMTNSPTDAEPLGNL